MSEPLFTRAGDTFVPSPHARGPWDPGTLHGGAPAALLARAVELLDSPVPMRCARLTFDFAGAVPLAPLTVHTSVVREGGRLQLVEAELRAGGTVAMRARVLRIRTEATGVATASDPPPGPSPEACTPARWTGPGPMEGFAITGMELRFSAGTFDDMGPGRAWFRLARSLVDDESLTPLQRVIAASDFGNGISRVLDFTTHLFVNPDLSVHLAREPRGEWVLLDSVTAIEPDGIGLTTSSLSDEHGLIGWAAQSLYVATREG